MSGTEDTTNDPEGWAAFDLAVDNMSHDEAIRGLKAEARLRAQAEGEAGREKYLAHFAAEMYRQQEGAESEASQDTARCTCDATSVEGDWHRPDCPYGRSKQDTVSTDWQAPEDLDPECYALCAALNAMPGIITDSSCCGHDRDPFRIWFTIDSLDALPPALYWFDVCHSGKAGWSITAHTDCGMNPVSFMVEGPVGAYEDADYIAGLLRNEAIAHRDSNPPPQDTAEDEGLVRSVMRDLAELAEDVAKHYTSAASSTPLLRNWDEDARQIIAKVRGSVFSSDERGTANVEERSNIREGGHQPVSDPLPRPPSAWVASDSAEEERGSWNPDAEPVQALLEAERRIRNASRHRNRADSVQAANRIQALDEMGWEVRPRGTTPPDDEEELVKLVLSDMDRVYYTDDDNHEIARRVISRVQGASSWVLRSALNKEHERAEMAEEHIESLNNEVLELFNRIDRWIKRYGEAEDRAEKAEKTASEAKERGTAWERAYHQAFEWSRHDTERLQISERRIARLRRALRRWLLEVNAAEHGRRGWEWLAKEVVDACREAEARVRELESAQPVRVTEEMIDRAHGVVVQALYPNRPRAMPRSVIGEALEAALYHRGEGEA